MDKEKELIEATVFLLTDSVISVHSAFESDTFKKILKTYTNEQKVEYQSVHLLVDATISFGEDMEPTLANYNIMIDNTDSLQEFLIRVGKYSNDIPQFVFFRDFYGYYKKIQTSLNAEK